MLLHLVSAQEADVAKAYKTVRGELVLYGEGLADKPEIVALSQIDTVDADELALKTKALKKASKQTPFLISSASRQGLDQVQRAMFAEIDAARTLENPVVVDKRWVE